MGIFDAGRQRRKSRRKARRGRKKQRQTARQGRRATKAAGRFDPDVVLARTQGRQKLVGQAMDIGAQVAGSLTGIPGLGAAQDAYLGTDSGGGGGDVYFDDDAPSLFENPVVIGGVVVGVGLVIYLVTKK